MASPSAPGTILLTALTGAELVDIIGSGPQSETASINTILTALGTQSLFGYTTNTATAGTTLTAANIDSAGLVETTLALTGTLGAGANGQLPTVAALVAAMPTSPPANASYKLRIINLSSANFAWTVTTNTGWTLNGTMTIPQNTWRDFYVSFQSTNTATLQTTGTGTAP